MTASTRTFISLGSLLFAIGCSGSDSSGGNNGNAQKVDPASQPGCSSAPACGSCTVCYEACVCETSAVSDNQFESCRTACAGKGTTSNPVGAGGAGQVGAGGAGQGIGGSVSQGGAGQVGGGGANQVGAGGSALGAGGAMVTPPASGEYTFKTDTVDVQPGAEIYKSQDFKNPFPGTIAIIESESFMTPGSHHMFAYHDPNGNPLGGGPIPNTNSGIQPSTGVEFHPYIHSAQTPQQLVQYPAGVGRSFPGGEGLRLQFHYINTGTAVLHAQVSLRVKYVDPAQIPTLAGEVFLNQALLNVPVGNSTQKGSTAMPYDIKLIGAASHMHMHAVNFVSSTSDGRPIYTTTKWDEPVGSAFNPPMDIKKGTAITWACSYQNNTNGPLTFGEHAQTNEMCIFSGLYYPAPGGAGIVSQF
jgi:hypothetical protein